MSIAYLADYHPLADSTGCIALWRAVIHRALCDACYQYFDAFMLAKHSVGVAGPQYISSENWRHAQDARKFLLAEYQGFENICTYADIDPAYLRRRARKAIADIDLMVVAIPPSPKTKNQYRSDRLTA